MKTTSKPVPDFNSEDMEAPSNATEPHQTILVSAETFDWLTAQLAEPPREIPELRRLLSEITTWKGE